MTHPNVDAALAILTEIGLPRAQLNSRSAFTLLALGNITPGQPFTATEEPLIGITPIMDWVRDHYGVIYAPNTRETFRRQTMHQFVEAGVARYNPDKPNRAVNSPKAVYQLTPEAAALLKQYATPLWVDAINSFGKIRGGLATRYACARTMEMVPVSMPDENVLTLSPGAHSNLIRGIVEDFAPRFAPGSILIYAGDTGQKHGYFNPHLLAQLGVVVDNHGKMPDVVLHFPSRNWLILAEAVTSHGPVDPKRHGELATLFGAATPGLVYVTAFPDRATMARYVPEIAWETEVWTADAPSHLVHFNGLRFLGPYAD